MLKRIAVAIMLVMSLILVTAPNQSAEARDYYVGTYSDGNDAYLITQSVDISSYYPYTFTCTVKYGHVHYLYYSFYPNYEGPYYRNSEGYQGYVFGGQSPVAANIYRFVVNNY